VRQENQVQDRGGKDVHVATLLNIRTQHTPRTGFTLLTISLCLGVDARVNRSAVLWWRVMTSLRTASCRVIVAAVACAALLVAGVPSATAAPTTDNQGYVDSTARCATPATAVLFGSTETSRVAICKTSGGQFEYRGVRLKDGAKLIVPASQSGGGYVADNDGVSYEVTQKSLVVSVGDKVIRQESMVDFHGTQAPPAAATTTQPTTAAPRPTTPTPTTPLPPPLPAEVGGATR
jgi:hypothetical protein